MRLATIRRPDGTTTAARLDGDELVVLPYPDVVALLAEPGWREAAAAPTGTASPWPRPTSPRPSARPRSSASGSTTAATSRRWAGRSPTIRRCSSSSPTR